MRENVSLRRQELDLYLRQSDPQRDLNHAGYKAAESIGFGETAFPSPIKMSYRLAASTSMSPIRGRQSAEKCALP